MATGPDVDDAIGRAPVVVWTALAAGDTPGWYDVPPGVYDLTFQVRTASPGGSVGLQGDDGSGTPYALTNALTGAAIGLTAAGGCPVAELPARVRPSMGAGVAATACSVTVRV